MFRFKAKIPVIIRLDFFVVAILIGALNADNLLEILYWVFLLLFSVLIHEYGHALFSSFFGQEPHIELMAFGGVTFPKGKSLSSLQEFIVILAGPCASFLIAFLGWFLLSLEKIGSSGVAPYLFLMAMLNFFWTFLNLIPVLPLDGGQLVRVICQALFGPKGILISAWSSFFFALSLSLFLLLQGEMFFALFFLFLLFQSVLFLKGSRWSVKREVEQKRDPVPLVLKLYREESRWKEIELLLSSRSSDLEDVLYEYWIEALFFQNKIDKILDEKKSILSRKVSKQTLCYLSRALSRSKEVDPQLWDLLLKKGVSFSEFRGSDYDFIRNTKLFQLFIARFNE